jgi:uncharacterized protein (DUF58 family)
MIRPTRRALLIFACGIPLALIAMASDQALWPLGIYFSLLIILAILADAALTLPSRSLLLEVAAPDRLYIGEIGTVTVRIAPLRYPRSMRIEMLLEQRGDAERPVLSHIDFHQQEGGQAALAVVPLRRGIVSIDRLWLRWRGPLGLAQISKIAEIGRQINVVPNIRGVQRAELRFFPHDALLGEKLQQQKGEGTEFEALREYRPGLDIRFIDWKHSARHRKLLCKEFRTERNHPVVLAFDTGHLMIDPLGPIPRLDHAINAALRLAWLSLRSGDLVGVFGFDARIRHYTTPMRGTQHFPRVQRATAQLAYHTQETNFTLGLAELNARLKRRALVILFTDFVDTTTAELLVESMHRIANRHVAVFVTFRDGYLREAADRVPDSFDDAATSVIAQDFLHDRSIVLERLSRIGVHCLDVPSAALPVALINRYLEIKQRGLI